MNYINEFQFQSFLGTQIKGIAKAGFKRLQQIAKYVEKLNVKVPEADISKSVGFWKIMECSHRRMVSV